MKGCRVGQLKSSIIDLTGLVYGHYWLAHKTRHLNVSVTCPVHPASELTQYPRQSKPRANPEPRLTRILTPYIIPYISLSVSLCFFTSWFYSYYFKLLPWFNCLGLLYLLLGLYVCLNKQLKCPFFQSVSFVTLRTFNI